jgi:hypothetical protein
VDVDDHRTVSPNGREELGRDDFRNRLEGPA